MQPLFLLDDLFSLFVDEAGLLAHLAASLFMFKQGDLDLLVDFLVCICATLHRGHPRALLLSQPDAVAVWDAVLNTRIILLIDNLVEVD